MCNIIIAHCFFPVFPYVYHSFLLILSVTDVFVSFPNGDKFKGEDHTDLLKTFLFTIRFRK